MTTDNRDKDLGFFEHYLKLFRDASQKLNKYGRSETRDEKSNSYWSHRENYKADWDGRAALATRLLKSDELRICDIGCGARFGLRNFLPKESQYFPCDMHIWTPDVRYCDLNKSVIPSDILKNSDATFLLGVIEYVHNVQEALSSLKEHCKTLILSYCSTDLEKRRWDKWVNALTGEQLRNLLTDVGYKVEWQVVYIPGQYIFRAVRE